jgi:hypothetical protein
MIEPKTHTIEQPGASRELSEPQVNLPAQYMKIAPSFSNAGAMVNGIESTLMPFAPKDLEDHY